MLTRFRALSSGSCLHELHFLGVIFWLRFSRSASRRPLILFEYFFQPFYFRLIIALRPLGVTTLALNK